MVCAVHDALQAFRSVARTRALTAVIVISLALGTGANAAVYSAVQALLFQGPAGVVAPGELVEIYTSQMNGGSYGESSYPDFQSIASARLDLRGLAASQDRSDAQLRLGDASAVVRAAAVSETYWDVLGLARPTTAGAVLSEDAWITLGRDPAAVGKPLIVDGRPYPIAAIAPPRFRGLHLDRTHGVWLPLDTAAPRGRGDRDLKLIGRLGAKPLDAVQADLNHLASQLARAYPETNVGTIRTEDEPRRFTAQPYSRIDPSARWRATLIAAILLSSTGLLLLSACVNAGSLLLSRGLARRAELTIKTALGADRSRLVRTFLMESVILATAGSAGGVLLARWTAAYIPSLFAPEHAALLDTTVQWPVMLATVAAGVLTGIACGLAPAVAATRALPVDALRGDPSRLGERPGAARLRMSLVAAQLALSTVFLAGSALVARAIDGALQMDLSAAPIEIAVAAIDTFDPEYRARALPALRAMPSVSRAGWVATAPLYAPARRDFRIQRGAVVELAEIGVNYASRGYFDAMRIPLLEGRFPTPEEEAAGDAVVVNEALARRYFGDRAVGSPLVDTAGIEARIVGIVRTKSYRALEGAQRPVVFYPMSRSKSRVFHAVVRARDRPERFHDSVFATLEQAGPTREIEITSFDDLLARALTTDRMIVALIGACGALALLLAAVGVYGVMGDLVRRRTREIGLRLALGAGPWRILQDVMSASLGPAFAGVAAGVGLAALLSRVSRTFVFELPAADLVTLMAIAGGLTVVVIAAVIPPAWRALRVSPLVALRD